MYKTIIHLTDVSDFYSIKYFILHFCKYLLFSEIKYNIKIHCFFEHLKNTNKYFNIQSLFFN
jgi:hypothetical protein